MLLKYEFLKIVKKKSTLIIMAVSILITALLFEMPAMQYQICDKDGMIKGIEGIKYTQNTYKDISVFLTEEYVTNLIKEVQTLFDDPENIGYDGTEKFIVGDAYWNVIAPKEKMLNMIASTYAGPNEIAGYNNLPEIDVSGGAMFYECMRKKIDATVNSTSLSMTNEQKEYWNKMGSKVKVPLQYGYYEGWSVVITSFELMMFAILAICMVTAPVFSGEYQAGTDAVILSGKYGKSKLINAKIAASMLFAILAFTIHILVACGLPLITFGFEGWNLPVQIANSAILYPITFLQATLINIGVIIPVMLAMVGLTLWMSSKMKTPYIVLTILVPIIFITMFLAPNGSTGLYNLILFLLPYRATVPELGKLISYRFGNLVVDVWTMRAIVYIVLTAVMIPLAKFGFKKHQVA